MAQPAGRCVAADRPAVDIGFRDLFLRFLDRGLGSGKKKIEHTQRRRRSWLADFCEVVCEPLHTSIVQPTSTLPVSGAFDAHLRKPVPSDNARSRARKILGGRFLVRRISRPTALGIIAVAAAIAVLDGEAARRAAWAQTIQGIDARVVAINIPGASAISQVGTFLNSSQGACGGSPIPSHFQSYVTIGAVLDPNRILVGSQSNFGAPPLTGFGQEGSFLSIDPNVPGILNVPANFASSGGQASTPE